MLPRKRRKSLKSVPPASDVDLDNASRLDRIKRDKCKALGGGKGNLSITQMVYHLADITYPVSVESYRTYKRNNPDASMTKCEYYVANIKTWDEKVGNKREDTSYATISGGAKLAKADALGAAETINPLSGEYSELFKSIETQIQPFPTLESDEFKKLLETLSKAGHNNAGVELFHVTPSRTLTASVFYTYLIKAYDLTSLLHSYTNNAP